MNANNGPTRMILINSGKYTFADVELTAPAHLVGPNNVGKTSLIAVLQFLYLDDQRQMHFSRSMPETRQYYFPDPYSYVLFELMTPTGFQVLGIHGLGPLRQFEFERFSYKGRLERQDYIDEDGRVREADEIRTALTERGWVRLEPKHHRAALTGVGDARGVELGLVPVRSQKDYDSFRSLFCNILRLSHIKQDELKQQLLDLYKSDFKQRNINLSEKYADGLEKVRRDAHEVHALKQLESDIDTLLRHVDTRDTARQALPGLWSAIGKAYEDAKRTMGQNIDALTKAIAEIEKDIVSAESTRTQLHADASACDQCIGVLRSKLSDVEKERAELADYIPEWVDEQLRSIQADMDRLTSDLERAGQDTPERVTRRLDLLTAESDALQQRIDSAATSLVAVLRKTLSDSDIQALFGLINPALMGAPLDTLNLSAEDALALARHALTSHQGGNNWAFGGQPFTVPAAFTPSLNEYTDIVTIQTALQDTQHEIVTLKRTLETARQAESLRLRREALRKDLETLNQRRFSWQKLQEKESCTQQWDSDLSDALTKKDVLSSDIRKNEETRNGLMAQNRDISEKRQSLETAGHVLATRVRALRPPPPEWQHAAAPPEGAIDDLVTLFEREQSTENGEHERVLELLTGIHQRTYGRYESDSETQTLETLRKQKESIPDREKSVEDLWTGIATAVRKHLKDIHGDVDTLKAKVSLLNRRLSSVGISNLKALRLEVDERPKWMSLLSNAMKHDDMPLFSMDNDADEALREIGKLFAEHPIIALADLFDLHFDVETSEGKHSRYAHLDNIESNGTTITIKVLVNLILLRELLANENNRTPFYLDECTSLDEANLSAIVEEAASLGFCAILASPDAMSVAERLYFIEEANGRVHLDPNTSLVKLSHE